jgi:hypothetical protein
MLGLVGIETSFSLQEVFEFAEGVLGVPCRAVENDTPLGF